MSLRSRLLIAVDDDVTLRELLRASAVNHLEAVQLRDVRQLAAILAPEVAINALVVGQKWMGQNPLELLANVRQLRPDLRRVMVATSFDLSSVVDALHSGAIHSVVYSPIDPTQFVAAAMGAPAPSRSARKTVPRRAAVAAR